MFVLTYPDNDLVNLDNSTVIRLRPVNDCPEMKELDKWEIVLLSQSPHSSESSKLVLLSGFKKYERFCYEKTN